MRRITSIAWLLASGVILVSACRDDDAPAKADASAPSRPRAGWIEVAPPPTLTPNVRIEHATTQPAVDGRSAAESPPDVAPMAPLADAKPGEWARYTTNLGWTQQYRLTDVTADGVSIEVRVVSDSGPLGMPATRREPPNLDWALSRAKTHKASVTARDDRIDAAGRSWACRLTIATFERGGVRYEQRTWMSGDAPVYGVVKSETVNAATHEVIAGFALFAFDDGGARGAASASR